MYSHCIVYFKLYDQNHNHNPATMYNCWVIYVPPQLIYRYACDFTNFITGKMQVGASHSPDATQFGIGGLRRHQ